jgi:hypothetical protein
MGLSEIVETERVLNNLLPKQRLEKSPPAELLVAASTWSQEVWAVATQMGPMSLPEDLLKKGNSLALRPVFICGVHRSGTTLMQNLLDGHPNLTVLPSEGTWFTNLEFKLNNLPENERKTFLGTEWLRRLANPINQPPYWLLGRSTDTGSPYVDFARYFVAWWDVLASKEVSQWPHIAVVLAYASATSHIEAKYWVDKTPTNERFLNRIWEEMPAARIIHIVRDPIDTITSRKKIEPVIGLHRALRDLKISYRVAIEQSKLNNPQFLLVRYEELCDTPKATISQIASFLQIEEADVLKHPTIAGISAGANSAFAKEAASGQILKPAQHPQHNILTGQEQQLIAAGVGELAGELNYPVVKIGLLRKWFLKLKYRVL